MRSKEERLRRLVCAEHCRLFKPWATEVEPCGVYAWFLANARGSDRLLDRLEKLRGIRPTAMTESDAAALLPVCRSCPHFPERCGYRAQGRTSMPPCGGLLVLKSLLEEKNVTFEDLYASLPANARPTPRPSPKRFDS